MPQSTEVTEKRIQEGRNNDPVMRWILEGGATAKAATSGALQAGQIEPWVPRGLVGTCSGGKLFVSSPGEAYDAQAGIQMGNS